jgi:hypothetical protein
MRHTTHVFLVFGVLVRLAGQGTEPVAVSLAPMRLPRSALSR